jgi:phenylpropionate dioxygenase-like ring-hydroxylating dioxygenase large terminal subunit
MKHSDQVRLIHEIFDCIDAGRPVLAPEPGRNHASVYTSVVRATRERDVLFRNYPIVVGFSSQAASRGDYFTEDLTPVPVVVVRAGDGRLRAFANVCRHRGARVASGCGSAAARFACPYHGWTYDLDGRLAAIPDDYGFEGIDRARHGLAELPVAERHGMVWVRCAGGGDAIDPDPMLAGLGAEIESYGIPDMKLQETRVVQRRMNWKLVSDTFWEAYHIKVLHKDNVAPLFFKNLAMFQAFGPNHRYVGVRKSIEKLRDLPEAKWDLVPHATILMNLFPNTVLVMQTDHAEVYRIFPSHDRPGESTTAISILAAEPSPKWARTMDMLLGVVKQDFELGEGIQRSFESGVIREVVYGRYEQALDHFHRSIREALGTTPR